jgi:hypothetical protein
MWLRDWGFGGIFHSSLTFTPHQHSRQMAPKSAGSLGTTLVFDI